MKKLLKNQEGSQIPKMTMVLEIERLLKLSRMKFIFSIKKNRNLAKLT
jgi:hypothetical protein